MQVRLMSSRMSAPGAAISAPVMGALPSMPLTSQYLYLFTQLISTFSLSRDSMRQPVSPQEPAADVHGIARHGAESGFSR
jgi:hypothetical protein